MFLGTNLPLFILYEQQLLNISSNKNRKREERLKVHLVRLFVDREKLPSVNLSPQREHSQVFTSMLP